jgi:dTDP-4-amino-4,6-dideoxygalactose transaminase
MNPPQARLARAGLDRLDEDICARATLARRYMAGLHGIAGLALPEFAGPIPAFTHFPIRCADRDGLLRFLTRRGRDAGAMTLPDCAGLPAFAAFNAECPAARCWARDALLLPCYARYPLTEADANVRAVREFFGTGGTGAHPGAA